MTPCLECGRQPGDGEACQWCGFVPASISERERAKAAVQAALRTLAEARAKAKRDEKADET